jgi:tetratricopeptide (TPR) repeat protein
VAQHHRVVILVDGLSQFERSTEARFVAWLRNGVPPNTRLIVTTAPGEELQTLTGRAGVQLLPLPTLDTDASEQIALAICQSYHRELNPDVLHELLRKRTRDGREAAGNPLASLQPDNIEWQQRIIGQYSGLGAVHWVKGEVQAALDSARQATQLGELAASQRPNDDEWLAETSLLYVNLGDILAKAGDGSGSIEAYRKCLAVRQRLASRAPTDGKRQVELSMGYEYLGDALHSQGRPGEAIQAQQQCLEIRQQLVSQAPGDAAPLRALVVTHTRLANLHQDLGQIKASNGHWIECHRLLSRMRNQGLELDPTFADLLRQLDKALGSA